MSQAHIEMSNETCDGEAAFPSFSMLELSESDLGVEYAFMYNCVRFYVTILYQDLEGEGTILDEFNNFKDDLDDPHTLFQFEDWILSPLQKLLDKEAPTPSGRQPITLLQYFSIPTFAFKFVNRDGYVDAIQVDYDPEINGDLNPRTRIVDAPASSHPRDHHSKGGVILRSALPQVPLVCASELIRVDDDLGNEELSDIPKRVRRISQPGHVFFFKAGLQDHGHLREMHLLDRIARSEKFEPPWQTSKLVGLVVWDEDPTCLMGLLMDYIDGETLQERARDAAVELKRKWIDQVEATLRRLHEIDIIWGGVKRDNVMIDANEDAVLVDFGGGYTPEYIPRELHQTAQGDLIGLDHMRAALGIRWGV
ncbi:hypothetical protein ACHAPT_005335 [Fusarium lateritium]